MTAKKLVIYTDGASRGNPGPAAIGVVIQDESGRPVATISQNLGEATNNQAEYRAIIAGLEKALALNATHVELRSDSELVVHQLSGKYRVKNEGLKPLVQKVGVLRTKFSSLAVSYIPREKNMAADRLANQALDGKKVREPAVASDIKVRRPVKTDYPAIIAIIQEMEKQHVDAVPQFFRTMTYEEQVADLDTILADPNLAFFVAERGGTILGLIHLAFHDEPVRGGVLARRYVKVRDLAVARKYQRSGTGKALMHAAEAWAKERGTDTIELNVWDFNREAFAFYQKLGYVTSSRHMWKQV
jgi:ribonuclease HI/GNAT superfamily N-acetyltransferase